MARLKTNLSAASLPTVLIVATLMLLSVAGVFIMYDRSNGEVAYSHYKMQQILNLESAVSMYCRDSLFLDKLSADSTVRLYDGKSNSVVKLSVAEYGLYEIVTVSSDHGKFVKSAVVGSANMGYGDPSFYIPNNYSPLSITGNSNLGGNVYVPRYGVSYNQMQYQVFSGKMIDSRNIKTSDTELPAPIYRDTLCFEEERLFLSKEMHLEDTILMAASIIVENGFRGTVQLIARDTVIIESEAVLKYPSGIYMPNDNPNRYVEIKEKAVVNGYVVMDKSVVKPQNRKPDLKTDIKSEIRGVVYVNGICQVQGTVTGKLFCDECSLFIGDGTYDNTVYNLTVNESNEVAAPILIRKAPYERRVIKWLN